MSVALPPGAAELAATGVEGSTAARACKAPFGACCEDAGRNRTFRDPMWIVFVGS